MAGNGNWIAGAIKSPGSFTKQAKAAGESTGEFRNKVLSNKGDFNSRTVKRAALARTLSKFNK